MNGELTSTNYRRSPMVKGGLEIPCKINVKMLSTAKNVELLNNFEELFADIYIEPQFSQILGSFLQMMLFSKKERWIPVIKYEKMRNH